MHCSSTLPPAPFNKESKFSRIFSRPPPINMGGKPLVKMLCCLRIFTDLGMQAATAGSWPLGRGQKPENPISKILAEKQEKRWLE